MRKWLDHILDALNREQPIVCVTAIEVLGSAPCSPGAKLLVMADIAEGTIGGGNLEFVAVRQAREMLASGITVLRQSLPLGPMLSQCCGGRVGLLYELYASADRDFVAAACAARGRLVTRIDPADHAKWLVADDGVMPFRAAPLDDLPAHRAFALQDDIWREPAGRDRQGVFLFGAGHIGRAMAKVLTVLDCDVTVVDPREDALAELPPGAAAIRTDDPATMGEWWRPGSLAIVFTHSHDLDYAWISAILHRGDSAFCGLIGSRTKRARFVRRLRGDGLDEPRIATLICPIGIDGLNSKEPGAVAISAAAQLLPLLADMSVTGDAPACACTASPASLLTD